MGGVAGAVIAAIIVGALYVGREIFIPIALAILLSFARDLASSPFCFSTTAWAAKLSPTFIFKDLVSSGGRLFNPQSAPLAESSENATTVRIMVL